MLRIKRIFLLGFLVITILQGSSQGNWKILSKELIVRDQGSAFSQCHASTIVELAKGKMMTAWFGGTHEGSNDVVIWMSIKDKKGWSKPASVANGIISDTLRYPCWNPVLFKDQSGLLHLYYKVGPNPREWWGMEIQSKDLGETWGSPVRLADGILGPIKNKPLQLKDGSILSPSSTETTTAWRAHIERSTDAGRSWQYIPIDTAGTYDVIQPSIVMYAGGRLQVLCRSKQGYVMQAWSDDNGKTWGPFSPTQLINPNSGTDAITLKNGQQLIVYNPDVPGKEWFNGRAKLRVATSVDGNTWKDVAILEDGTTEEYSYPAVIQTADGLVHITYTFDRKNVKHVVLHSVNK